MFAHTASVIAIGLSSDGTLIVSSSKGSNNSTMECGFWLLIGSPIVGHDEVVEAS